MFRALAARLGSKESKKSEELLPPSGIVFNFSASKASDNFFG